MLETNNRTAFALLSGAYNTYILVKKIIVYVASFTKTYEWIVFCFPFIVVGSLMLFLPIHLLSPFIAYIVGKRRCSLFPSVFVCLLSAMHFRWWFELLFLLFSYWLVRPISEAFLYVYISTSTWHIMFIHMYIYVHCEYIQNFCKNKPRNYCCGVYDNWQDLLAFVIYFYCLYPLSRR